MCLNTPPNIRPYNVPYIYAPNMCPQYMLSIMGLKCGPFIILKENVEK